MLKMLLDAGGGIVLTNDGNAILREIDVSHPAAKSIIELSRTQDEEVGDGTTSVIILAGERRDLTGRQQRTNFLWGKRVCAASGPCPTRHLAPP
jgi:chaperonin GroEL (HSP60 family)